MTTKDLFYFASRFMNHRTEFRDCATNHSASEIIDNAYQAFQSQTHWTIDGWFIEEYHDWAKRYVGSRPHMDEDLKEVLLS